jgi:hypothetical protein
MSNVYDGGPAFPPSTRAEGMSLRAYFMAHAPAEPQPWFRPICDALTAPPYQAGLKNLTAKEADELDGRRDGFLSVDTINSPRVREHVLALDASNKARTCHGQELERQRYLQWPAAWADAQLAILKGQP